MDAVQHAVGLVKEGDVVGMGTGRAATAFVRALGERVRSGFSVCGIPTSEDTMQLARELRIPLTTFESADKIDIAVDGADEVDSDLNLIKGYGGALIRERIVAAAARKFVVIVGREKLVKKLGERGKLPVEVVPFGVVPCCRHLETLGSVPVPRRDKNGLLYSDNGNALIDCEIETIENPRELERSILAIPGIVGTGLFIGATDLVLIDDDKGVQIRQKK